MLTNWHPINYFMASNNQATRPKPTSPSSNNPKRTQPPLEYKTTTFPVHRWRAQNNKKRNNINEQSLAKTSAPQRNYLLSKGP